MIKVRYHFPGNDGLYTAIAFLFVTDRMAAEIAAERQQILDSLPERLHDRQRLRFERYDPQRSSTAFNAMLRLFNPAGCDE